MPVAPTLHSRRENLPKSVLSVDTYHPSILAELKTGEKDVTGSLIGTGEWMDHCVPLKILQIRAESNDIRNTRYMMGTRQARTAHSTSESV